MGASTQVQLIVTAFLGGILSASYFHFGISACLLVFAGVVGMIALVSSVVLSRLLFLCGVFFVFGIFIFQSEAEKWGKLQEEVSFYGEVRVISLESPKAFYRGVILRPIDESALHNTRILWRAPIVFEAIPGDQLHFDCTLVRPKNFDSKFDYRIYLATKKIGYVCERGGIAKFLASPRVSPERLFSTIHRAVAAHFETLLPEPVAGFALGLILGGNDYISREITDEFARTGLSHIVAVSGFNMAILVQCTIILGWLIGLSRKASVLLSLAVIIGFLVLIGAPASAVRAVIMVGVGFLAYFFGRLPGSFTPLLMAAAGMLLLNPLLLRYDIGFELSFLATLALVAVSPYAESWKWFRTWWGKILSLFFLTLVIELFTWPVLLSAFGQMTWLAPLTNFLVLPVIPVAMLLALGVIPIIILFPVLAPFALAPLYTLLAGVLWLVHFFASLPFGLFTFSGHISPVVVCLWYTCLFLFFWYLRHRERYVLAISH